MNEVIKKDVELVVSRLDKHGPISLNELSKELGSTVRAVVAVGEVSRRGWARVVEQDSKTLIIEPRRRRSRQLNGELNDTRKLVAAVC